jgi:hypothetical protein
MAANRAFRLAVHPGDLLPEGAECWIALANGVIRDGRALFQAPVDANLEGIVAKHLGAACHRSPHVGTRSSTRAIRSVVAAPNGSLSGEEPGRGSQAPRFAALKVAPRLRGEACRATGLGSPLVRSGAGTGNASTGHLREPWVLLGRLAPCLPERRLAAAVAARLGVRARRQEGLAADRANDW